jgi:hypothetical protein
MFGFAVIRKPRFPEESLDVNKWRRFIRDTRELRPLDSLMILGQKHPIADGAELIEEGNRVGVFVWEQGQIYVDGPNSMIPIANAIAKALDANLYDDSGEPMIESSEEAPVADGWQMVHHHVYEEAFDLSYPNCKKDFITLFDHPKNEVSAVVGQMLDKTQMQTTELPVTDLRTSYGKIADEVHEWPNATLGADFQHLVLNFADGRLIGYRWTACPQLLNKVKPRWKFW